MTTSNNGSWSPYQLSDQTKENLRKFHSMGGRLSGVRNFMPFHGSASDLIDAESVDRFHSLREQYHEAGERFFCSLVGE